jgi:hypothetical protein
MSNFIIVKGKLFQHGGSWPFKGNGEKGISAHLLVFKKISTQFAIKQSSLDTAELTSALLNATGDIVIRYVEVENIEIGTSTSSGKAAIIIVMKNSTKYELEVSTHFFGVGEKRMKQAVQVMQKFVKTA